MSRQIDFETMPKGTYANCGQPAQQALRFNRFCYDLRIPENREAFKTDPEAAMARYGLDETERVLVRQRDWLGLVRRGGNVFVLLRLSQLCGHNLTETGAQMRGETLEQYLASRQVTKGT